jgi:hypothetical protein
MHIKWLINIIAGLKHLVEGAKGTKVKVLFLTHVIFVLVYNL